MTSGLGGAISGLADVFSTDRGRARRLARTLEERAALLGKLPEGSSAHDRVREHVDYLAETLVASERFEICRPSLLIDVVPFLILLVGVGLLVDVASQLWGDLGFFAMLPAVMVAVFLFYVRLVQRYVENSVQFRRRPKSATAPTTPDGDSTGVAEHARVLVTK